MSFEKFAIWIVLAILVGFLAGRTRPSGAAGETLTPKVDTLVVRDTIVSKEAVFVTRRVVDSIMVPVTDTVKMRDTLFVFLEREQVRWEDSLSVVYASGVRPKVDSVIHYTRHQIITKEIPVIQYRRTRWGVGIQAGAAAGKDGVAPYVGIGVSYNLLSW